VTLTLTFDPAIPHTVVHHSSTSTDVPNFIQIEETFCGRTDVQTYGRTDISPLYTIRSTLGSRPKYEHSQHWSTAHVILHPHQRQHKTSNVILSCHHVCHGCLSKLCIIMIMMMININCIIYHCMITIMMTLILLVLFMVAVFLLITITDVIIVIINKDEFNVPLRATAARTCYKM